MEAIGIFALSAVIIYLWANYAYSKDVGKCEKCGGKQNAIRDSTFSIVGHQCNKCGRTSTYR